MYPDSAPLLLALAPEEADNGRRRSPPFRGSWWYRGGDQCGGGGSRVLVRHILADIGRSPLCPRAVANAESGLRPRLFSPSSSSNPTSPSAPTAPAPLAPTPTLPTASFISRLSAFSAEGGGDQSLFPPRVRVGHRLALIGRPLSSSLQLGANFNTPRRPSWSPLSPSPSSSLRPLLAVVGRRGVAFVGQTLAEIGRCGDCSPPSRSITLIPWPDAREGDIDSSSALTSPPSSLHSPFSPSSPSFLPFPFSPSSPSSPSPLPAACAATWMPLSPGDAGRS